MSCGYASAAQDMLQVRERHDGRWDPPHQSPTRCRVDADPAAQPGGQGEILLRRLVKEALRVGRARPRASLRWRLIDLARDLAELGAVEQPERQLARSVAAEGDNELATHVSRPDVAVQRATHVAGGPARSPAALSLPTEPCCAYP